MKNNSLVIGLLGAILGSLLTYFIVSNSNSFGSVRHMGMMGGAVPSSQMMGAHGSNMSMSEMTIALEGLQGEEFDKAFIEIMIDHHQGAIDMANLAKLQAEHQEIKTLSEDIIEAQTSEIEEMRSWQNSWGY